MRSTEIQERALGSNGCADRSPFHTEGMVLRLEEVRVKGTLPALLGGAEGAVTSGPRGGTEKVEQVGRGKPSNHLPVLLLNL